MLNANAKWDITSHRSDGYHQKIHKQAGEGVGRRKPPALLLVGMQIDTATMVNNIEVP